MSPPIGSVFAERLNQKPARYLGDRHSCQLLEIWKPNRQVRIVKRGYTLRVQVPASFRLHWTGDEWRTVNDTASAPTAFGVDFVDIPITPAQRAPLRFTLFWPESNSWEGRDYLVEVED